jgi:hypothetical protein
VTLANGKQVPYFEAGYSDIYISCNGHIRFLPPPPPFYSYGISLDKHLAKPGVAALLENFAPETSDQVSMRELIDRVVVTWQNVASWGDTDSNSFQIELYFDGRIAITHLNVARNSGIIGLSRGQGRPINFALSDFRNYPAASQFKVELPPAAVEGRGLMEGRGIVSVTPATETALMVTLVSSGASELVLPSSIMIPAGKTRAFFDVNIMDDAFVDGSQTATATASAPGFIDGSGSIIVHDNESAFLSVLLPASTAESSAPVTGSVLVTPAPIHDVVVQLYSDDLSEATVPATVTINAGQTSASFNLSPVNDTLIDGPQAIHITAQVSGWTTGSSSIIVNDDEARQLALVLPTSAAEGKTGLNGQVSLSGSISTTLVVSLQCSDTSEIMVPTTVKISAGRSSASFPITVADDGLIDGSQPVVITATADTFTGGSGNLVVEDNDPHHFSFSVISGTQVKNGSFLATITALNADNSVMTNFTGPVSLSGIGVAGPVGVSPAVINGFVGGVWTGTLAVTVANTNVILTVADNHGKVGASNEFDVLAMGPHNAFAWNAIPQAQVNGSGIPVSLTAIDAGRNPVTTFGGTATISGMQESTQTIGTSTSTTHDLPFNTNYEEERSQIIYTTAELGGAKYLTSLAFFVTDVGVPSLLTHLCVRLRHTSKADFSGSGAVWERDIDLITVFEGDQKLVQGWNTFLFNAPFRYNGTSNLLVDVCYDLAANSSLAWTTVRRTAATTNRAMYATAFLNQKGDPAAWVGSTPLPTLSTRVPNIRFGILTPLAVSPSVSGTFSAGQWQGVVTVSQELKNFRLLASDASGHEGLSQAFDVLPYVPVIGISPASLSFSVPYGGTQTKSLTIFNTGQGVLNWSLGNAADNSLNAHNQSMKLDLTQVRQELNTAYHSITSLIPNRFDFDGGEVGNSIGENNNLYFDGNWLNTNLGSRRSYSNDAIISTTAFGVGGSYFTRKYPGLFVLAADALNISHFEVSGSLAGYATNMDTSVITQSRGSMTYKGFIKRVFGPTVPSVNHLIIVADNGSVNHTAAADPADDLHRVSSLNGISRLYYLLFSRWQNQAGYVSDAVMADIMSTFLDTVESPKEFVFSTAAGTVVPGGSKTVSVTANTMNVPSGIYSRSLVLTTGHAAVPLERVINFRKRCTKGMKAAISFGWHTKRAVPRRVIQPMSATRNGIFAALTWS